jgi:hypothetical protein
MMGKPKSCELYRHFDGGGRLLYVGIAWTSLERLMNGHRSGSHWFDQITRIEIERFPSRVDALAAEKAAIRDEKPMFNLWTDTRRGIQCRSDDDKQEIGRLLTAISGAGYRVRKNACLSVLQAISRSIDEGREPDRMYLLPLTRRLSTKQPA